MSERKIIVRKLRLLIAGVLCCLFIPITTFAEDVAPNGAISLYSTLPANKSAAAERTREEQAHLFMQLKKGYFGHLRDLQSKARITLRSESRRMLAETQGLILQPPSMQHTYQWSNKGASFFWRQDFGESSHPLIIPLTLNNLPNILKIGDFEEIWLDYKSLPHISSCNPELNIRVSAHSDIGDVKTLEEIDASTSKNLFGTLTPLKTISVINSEWREKGYDYLIKRLFGMTSNLGWVYVQNQKTTLIQRLLNERIDNVDSLDIVVAPGTKIERINLMVNQNYGSTNELLEFDTLRNIILPDGREAVRLELHDSLKARFPKGGAGGAKQQFYLKEIFIFIPGKASTISKSKPLLEMVFLARANTSAFNNIPKSEQIILEAKVDTANSYSHRMIVDLRKLKEEGALDLTKSALHLMPPEGAKSCAIHIEGVRFVNTYNGSVPMFLREIENFGRRLGGGFSGALPDYDLIESPGIISYLPLSMLTLSKPPALNAFVLGVDSLTPYHSALEQNKRLPYRIEGFNGKDVARKNGSLISSNGATLSIEGEMPRVKFEGDALVLEGRSREMEISWPVRAHINNKTQFYFGVGEGVEQLSNIALTLSLANGRTINRTVAPNQPLLLLAGDTEIRGVSLRVVLSASPYRLKLQDIILFSPTKITYAQAFNLPLPKFVLVYPKPILTSENSGVLELQRGRVTGLMLDEPVRFSTFLDPALDFVSGVRLKYSLPLAYGDSKRCPLSLQFNWTNGKTKRQVCFEKNKGDLDIPMAKFLEGTDKAQNLGALKSVDWLLLPIENGGGEGPESFDLEFTAYGWSMLSILDRIRLTPLFNVDTSPIYSNLEGGKEIIPLKNSHKIWVPLDDNTVSLVLAGGGQIKPVENQLYTLDQVVVELRRPINWDQLHELSKAQILDSSLNWFRWVVWFAVIALTGMIWKIFSHPYSVLTWIKDNEFIKVLVHGWRLIIAVGAHLAWRILPRVNLAIGTIALVLCLWLSGRNGLSFAGVMLLIASALFAWGVYYRWYEMVRPNFLQEKSWMGTRFFLVLALAISCAIWAIGRYKWSIEALWGLLPLFGIIYLLLPSLYKLARLLGLKYRGYLWLVLWTIISLTFYTGGLLFKVNSEKDYLLLIGRLTAIFALHAGMLLLKSSLLRFYPVIVLKIYGAGGNLYFLGFLVLLFTTAIALCVKLRPIADELAILAFISLAIGAGQAVWMILKKRKG